MPSAGRNLLYSPQWRKADPSLSLGMTGTCGCSTVFDLFGEPLRRDARVGNQKDLRDLPHEVRKEMEFVFADRVEDVLAVMLPALIVVPAKAA